VEIAYQASVIVTLVILVNPVNPVPTFYVQGMDFVMDMVYVQMGSVYVNLSFWGSLVRRECVDRRVLCWRIETLCLVVVMGCVRMIDVIVI
jgi:hypothetical protein